MPEQVRGHFDRGYGAEATHKRLGERHLEAMISEEGKPAPFQQQQSKALSWLRSWTRLPSITF